MKDLTKYKFNDMFYGKGRLIQAILTDYINKHKSVTLEKLQDLFPKSLNGKFEVITTLANAKRIGGDRKRYYVDEPIILKDGTKVVICSQFGRDNVHNIFILFKKYYGYNFRKV